MNRRTFLYGLTLGALSVPLAAEAQQQAGKVWRVGDVFAGSAEVSAYLSKALEDRLADRGYVNGRNISLIHQFVPPEPARLEKAIATLISNIDVLVVWGTVSAVAAKKVTGTLPIVFLTVGDPVAIGLAKSLARPGGNMTGVTHSAPQLRIQLLPIDVRSADDLKSAFATMTKTQAQGVVVVAGAFTYLNRQQIVELALAHHLPSSLPFKEAVAAGGLVSLGPDLVEMARQGAAYVDKIVRGANPGDLPVEQPTRYELHVNLKTAKALGLTIPQSLLVRADQVIE